MRGSILLQVSLLLCLVGCSLQGGTGAVQSPVSSPLAVKAGGRYPQFGPQGYQQGYQQGPTGIRNGYEAGYGVKAGKPAAGSLGVLPAGKQKPGYGNGRYPSNFQQQGIGAKPSKAGYGQPVGGVRGIGAQPGYGNGLYPSNLQQQGIGGKPPKAGYGAPAGGLPNVGVQPGYGNGLYPSNVQQPGIGGKPPKAGYGSPAGVLPGAGVQPGFLNGAGRFPSNIQQPGFGSKPSKAGYGPGNYPRFGAQAGLGAKPSKAGAFQQPYPNGAYQQQPYPNSAYQQQPYPNGLNNFLGNGKGQGVKSPYGSLGALGKSSKQGALGKFPYKSQPLPADALGYDSKSLKNSGAQLPFASQAGYPDPASVKYGGGPVPYGPQGAYPDPSAIKYGGVPQYPETASSPISTLEEDLSQNVPLEGTQLIAAGPTTPPTTQASPSTLKQKAYKVPEEQAAYRFYGTGYQGCAEC
ncbi:hypothetical protein XENTR_v10023646 [Xenopus tropicalis]|nr:hypothetical protein XENTR_v10023646 [Xenopus tropicalis]